MRASVKRHVDCTSRRHLEVVNRHRVNIGRTFEAFKAAQPTDRAQEIMSAITAEKQTDSALLTAARSPFKKQLFFAVERPLESRETEANRRGHHGPAYCLANAAAQRWAGSVVVLLLLQHPAPSRLWMGMGRFFRTIEQGATSPLVLPLL